MVWSTQACTSQRAGVQLYLHSVSFWTDGSFFLLLTKQKFDKKKKYIFLFTIRPDQSPDTNSLKRYAHTQSFIPFLISSRIWK
jgi:hypothetical protein